MKHQWTLALLIRRRSWDTKKGGKLGLKEGGKRTVEGATDIRESNPKKVRRAGNMIQMEQIGAMKSRGGA